MTGTGSYGIIWDMDGTLVDTAEQHFAAWAQLAAGLHKPFTREDFAATFGRRNPEIIAQLFGSGYNTREIDELGSRKEDFYRAAARRGVDLLPGVRKLLGELQAAGFLQAIGSSAPRGNLDLILDLTHIHPFFAAVVAMEDTSRGKPDPQVFLVAAEKMGVPAERCLVLEDAVAGVQAARAGGMRCIAVSFVGHHSPEKLKAAGADLVVPTLDQVSVATVREILQG